jgi:hypothetical protein
MFDAYRMYQIEISPLSQKDIPQSLINSTPIERQVWFSRYPVALFGVFLKINSLRLRFFLRARVCWPLLCFGRPFCIFDRCLDSKPESCRNKQARYQLSHLSHSNLATHLPFYLLTLYLSDIAPAFY